jgi:hypothetical protein
MSGAASIPSAILAYQQVLQRASEGAEPGLYVGVAEFLDERSLREVVAETLTANATYRAAIACNDAIRAKAQMRLTALDATPEAGQ